MLRPIQTIAIVCVTVAMPFAALAEKPALHTGKAKGHAVQTDITPAMVTPAQPERLVRVGGAKPCPPGLAKKDPTCAPPGQAQKHGYAVGETVDWNVVHLVTRPGLYGLTAAPAGQRYAIVDGRLVRVDSKTGRILSILRAVEAILD